MIDIFMALNALIGMLALLSAADAVTAGASPHLLRDFVINANSISITSFAFNPSEKTSSWVDRIFGSKAVYWNEPFVHNGNVSIMGGNSNTRDIPKAAERFRQHAGEFPLSYEWPQCSIEMLGIARLGIQSPFLIAEKFSKLSFGKATLTFEGSKDTWTCRYRGIYERWAELETKVVPGYRSVIFFCPAPVSSQSTNPCEAYSELYNLAGAQISAADRDVKIHLEMGLSQNNWGVDLKTYAVGEEGAAGLLGSGADLSGNSLGGGGGGSTSSIREPRMAICTAWPYASSDARKKEVSPANDNDTDHDTAIIDRLISVCIYNCVKIRLLSNCNCNAGMLMPLSHIPHAHKPQSRRSTLH